MLQGVFLELRVNPVGADPCVRPENAANISFTFVEETFVDNLKAVH